MSLPLARLTTLDLVRGFVAVGRRMSVTLAAQELCLTQSAVSRQVAALERTVGTPLFFRGHRSIAFTPAGERLFRSADGALQQLQDALGELQSAAAERPVVLGASIGVTGLWLLPRLARFQARHPGTELRLSASDRVADMRHEGIDLVIRYAPADNVPPGAQRLFGETVAPVVAASGAPALASPRTLAKATLLEFDAAGLPQQRAWLQWRHWLDARGWPQARPRGMLHFNQYDQIIQAALAGQGAALGRFPLLQPLLDDGRLVLAAPDVPALQTPYAYWLITAQAAPREAVRRVARWVVEEAGA